MAIKTLVIVESATKAGVIEKYLNSNKETSTNASFKVVASQGHIRDISAKGKNMGIDPETFECSWVLVTGKGKVVSNLKEWLKKTDFVYLATDNDREGEGIAWHLKEHFKIPSSKCKRIVFNEITESALVRAVHHAKQIDQPMVDSYISRRVLDRLVGFMISKLLWKSFESNVLLTTGRVQGVALKEIIAKEDEIRAFDSVCYWTVLGDFGAHLRETTLYRKGGVHKETNQEHLVEMLKAFSKATFAYTGSALTTKKESPPSPFITSTLQQVAYSSCGFSIKRTMCIAQELYEMGAITYMRTDSTHISHDFSSQMKAHVEKTYGSTYSATSTTRRSSSNAKHAQEAHEAIRPTSTNRAFKFSPEQQRLYELIFKRTLAFFMANAVHHEVVVTIGCDKLSNEYEFVGKEKALYFDGWLRVYEKEVAKVTGDALLAKYARKNGRMTPITFTGHCIWSSPPTRYNESSVVNMLEKNGIGRPSTYASILAKLFDKQYVDKRDVEGVIKKAVHLVLDIKAKTITHSPEEKVVGAEKSRIVPTKVGHTVNDFVSRTFPQIVNVQFTAKMEDSLDQIASNAVKYKDFLRSFYVPFKRDFDNILGAVDVTSKESLKSKGVVHIHKGKEYLVRQARYGPVIEYIDDAGTTKFIGLKHHLKYTKKKLDDVDISDVVSVLEYNFQQVRDTKNKKKPN